MTMLCPLLSSHHPVKQNRFLINTDLLSRRRCDRGQPCGTCVRMGYPLSECIYVQPVSTLAQCTELSNRIDALKAELQVLGSALERAQATDLTEQSNVGDSLHDPPETVVLDGKMHFQVNIAAVTLSAEMVSS
ncbi:hypothetical protein BX600DRAFT_435475 [Xylariales sp. PMI_506]|nr:hypothetical protein BX600DRAFT_435475 [Xylariales sp. PMI_506]